MVVPLRPALPLPPPGLQRHQHEMGGSQDARAWGEGGPWGCGSPRRLAGMRPPAASCSVHGCKRRLPAAPALLPAGSQVSTHPDYKVTAFMDHTAMLTVQHPKYGEQGVQSAQSGRASQAPWASLGPGLGMAWNLGSLGSCAFHRAGRSQRLCSAWLPGPSWMPTLPTSPRQHAGLFDCKPLAVLWARYPQYGPHNTIMLGALGAWQRRTAGWEGALAAG